MPRNGTGTYSLPQAPFVAGTTISSAAMNSDLSDIASALTASLPRDGQAGMTGALLAANGSSLTPSISFANDKTSGFFSPSAGVIGIVIEGSQIGTFSSAGGSFTVPGIVPVGVTASFAGSAAPSQWILCFGQAVSRTTYALLFAVIGTSYGSGDGVTTFNLPDLRGRLTPGADNMGGTAANRLTTNTMSGAGAGSTGGAETETLSTAQIPSHSHANTLGDPGHQHTVFTSSGQSPQAGSGNPGATVVGGGLTGASGTGMTITNASIGGGGAHINVQPSLTMNTIIFAGA